jgi:hypothetical protein
VSASSFSPVTDSTFQLEIAAALKAYEHFVVCLDKSPEEFLETVQSLVLKACRAYENRGPNLRHGIALDQHVTVILSQSDTERPWCGIYFNLHSPYQRQCLPQPAKGQPKQSGELGGPAKA